VVKVFSSSGGRRAHFGGVQGEAAYPSRYSALQIPCQLNIFVMGCRFAVQQPQEILSLVQWEQIHFQAGYGERKCRGRKCN